MTKKKSSEGKVNLKIKDFLRFKRGWFLRAVVGLHDVKKNLFGQISAEE